MTESNTKILFFMGIYINLNKTGLSLLQELFDQEAKAYNF